MLARCDFDPVVNGAFAKYLEFGTAVTENDLIITGGEGQYTQWVHCELIVGSETIRLAHTQRVNSGHI